MRIENSRRAFLRGMLIAPTIAVATWLSQPALAESLTLNWQSSVIQVPVENQQDTPPVITTVGIHPDGRTLAIAGDDHAIYLWNLAEGKVVQRLLSHTDWVHTLAFSPHGKALATAGADRQVIFWDVETGSKLYVFQSHIHPITKIAWSHNGAQIAGLGFEDRLRIYDTQTRRLSRDLTCPCHDMRAIEYSPDDSLLAAGGRDGVVRIWKVADGSHVADYPAHRHRIRALTFSPDGGFLVSTGEDRKIHVRQIADKAEDFKLPDCPAKALSLAFYGPHQLAIGCSDNLIRLYDVAARTELGKLSGHTGSVAALAARGNILVSGSFDATVRVWQVTENVAGEGRPLPLRTSRKPE